MTENDFTPDFVRGNAKADLNGVWYFSSDDADIGVIQRWYVSDMLKYSREQIIVPFSYETAASDIQDKRQHKIIWYRKDIKWADLPSCARAAETDRTRYFLHFGAVDYECTVWINGSMVGSHIGGHTSFSFEISEHIRGLLGSEQLSIVVRCKDSPNDMAQPRGKQYWKQDSSGRPKPESIFYTPTTGIWQDVWIESRPLSHIVNARFTSDIDAGTVRADVDVNLVDPSVSGFHPDVDTAKLSHYISFTVKFNSQVISTCQALVSPETGSCSSALNVRQSGVQPQASVRARFITPGVLPPEVNRDRWDNGLALWSPESPSLYDIEMKLLGASGEELDKVQSYFGIRKVSIDDQGRFCLNNRVYFQKLILNQGYWPECGMTAPATDTFREEIVKIKQMGFNGVRMHQKVENKQFLCEADRLGLLVWGEMANAYEFSTTYVERFTKEWIDVVRRDISHPCIVAWVPINESWGVPALNTSAQQRAHLMSLYHLTKALDPTRPVIDNDGWQHVETDMITVHDYRSAAELEEGFKDRESAMQERVVGYPVLLPPLSTSEKRHKLPILCTEFGGLALKVDNVGTTAGGVDWGYANASSQEDFLEQFEALVKALTRSKEGTGTRIVQGLCWTQAFDVQAEVNGLLTKDREFKVPPEKIKAILDAI